MRVLLALLATLPLLAVGSGATAGASSSVPLRNGLIAIHGVDGLYLVDPAAGSTSTVPGTEEAEDAAWSPDGTRLAVSMWTPEEETPGVYTMKPDGTDRALVIGNASSPTWSPDGAWLAVVRHSGLGLEKSQLVVVGADGGDERVLLPKAGATPMFFSKPAWSPDGQLIAFVGEEGRIGLITPDGEKGGVFDVDGAGSYLSWSPDSSRLAFSSFRGLKSERRQVVVILDLATGKETVLAGEQHGAAAPAWSPEGDQIAFLSMSLRATQPATTGHSCGGEPYEMHLWSMRPDGTKAHRLAEDEFYGQPNWGRAAEAAPAPAPVADQQPEPAPVADREPAPAADDVPPAGEKMPAVTSKPAGTPPAKTTAPPVSVKGVIAVRGSNAIYLVDVDGAGKVPGTADMVAPAWSPDASLLAVERVAKGGNSIYTIRPDGTNPQLVLADARAPSWSPDGGRIFALRGDDEEGVLYSVRPDGSDLQRFDVEAADFNDPRELAWRVDGTPIGFFEDDSVTGPGTFDTAEAAWSPDETTMAFIGAVSTTEDTSADTVTAGLWIVSADGGTPQLLLEGASGWPSWRSGSR